MQVQPPVFDLHDAAFKPPWAAPIETESAHTCQARFAGRRMDWHLYIRTIINLSRQANYGHCASLQQ